MAKQRSLYFDAANVQQKAIIATIVKAIPDPQGWQRIGRGFTLYAAKNYDTDQDILSLMISVAEYMKRNRLKFQISALFVYDGYDSDKYLISGDAIVKTASIEWRAPKTISANDEDWYDLEPVEVPERTLLWRRT